jgi:hypothetical protein
MEHLTPRQLPATQPDIRDARFCIMIERLVQWYPLAFGVLFSYSPKSAWWYMQSQLQLQPVFCSDVYRELAMSYLITPTDTGAWWVRKHDVTLSALHQRLWHEANCADPPFYRKAYRLAHPLDWGEQ